MAIAVATDDEEDPRLVGLVPTQKPFVVLPEDFDYIWNPPPLESLVACPNNDEHLYAYEVGMCPACWG